MNKSIAIIMRSKDEWPYVEEALRALEAQSLQDYVLYNIDSGSTDGTWESVLRHNHATENIVRIASRDYVPGPVLNRMIAMTHEPIIVFLNSDAIAKDDRMLQNLVGPILKGRADCTVAVQEARASAYFIVKDDYQRAYDAKRYVSRDLDFFSAVCCAFRRSLWEQVKFPTSGLAEDYVWFLECKKRGARFQMVGDAKVEHSHNYSLRQLFKRRYEEGVTFGKLGSEPSGLLYQLGSWGRELVRDLWRAVRAGAILSIPYNIAYRTVTHAGYYWGKREGAQLRGVEHRGGCEER